MFFAKKISGEQQKEIRLNVLQLERLIERALNNTNKAIVAFDKSFENLYGSESDLLRKTLHVTEFMSADRLVENNEGVLSEIEEIFKSRLLRTPVILRAGLKKVKGKNHQASIMFNVYHRVESAWEDSQDPAAFLVNQVTLESNFRDDLVQVLTSLNDFQDLFRKQYSVSSFDYVHRGRLDDLSEIKNENFDLVKLIRLCEELNIGFQNGNYLSVTILIRAILDHVPPIFRFKTFVEVSNNYGGKSLKKSLQNLQSSSRNIADAYLHEPIRSKESLPNETQIDFRNDLDVLLSEIIRVLK